MVVGDDIAILGENEAGAGGGTLAGLAIVIGLDGAGNGNHALGVVFIHHPGSLSALGGDGIGHVGCRDGAGTAQGVQLLLHGADGRGCLLHLILPLVIDGGIGQAAAAGHQCQRQDSADCLAQTGAVLGLIYGCGGLGIGFGFKFLGDVIFRVVVVKGLHRDSSLRFICLYHNPHL